MPLQQLPQPPTMKLTVQSLNNLDLGDIAARLLQPASLGISLSGGTLGRLVNLAAHPCPALGDYQVLAGAKGGLVWCAFCHGSCQNTVTSCMDLPAQVRQDADALLRDADAEDAARDYVERAVGRFHFNANWRRQRDPAKVEAWLHQYGYSADPKLVVDELDRLADGGPWAR